MKRFRNEAFFKEFEFLRKWKEEEHEPLIFEAEISIKRLDNEILRETIDEEFHDGSLVDYENQVRVVAILRDGSMVEDYKSGYYYQSNRAHVEPQECEGETLLEWIDRKKIVNDLQFIVIHRYGHDFISDQKSEYWNYLTIYKLPKNKTVKMILDEAKKEVEKSVLREINF